jgi:membrane-associated phospholipid phosphatase
MVAHASQQSEITPFWRTRVLPFWALAAALVVLGLGALTVDVPLGYWVYGEHAPRIVNKICGLSETLGHGVGIAIIVLFMAVLDPAHRHVIPRVLAASLGSGLVSNIFKLLLARTRPAHYDWSGNALDTFGPWLPLLNNHSSGQSFPSSHAATAAGLAIALSYVYPRGRFLFPAFAALACFQRVLEQSHFTSDVFWGAAVGCCFAPLCIYASVLARSFDELEARWITTPASAPMGHRPAAPARDQSRAA